MGAQAFDLADRLQTPIFVMLDLDIGMQDWLTEPFAWDDSAPARPRQGDDARPSSRRARTSAATSTSTATAFRTARIRARTRRRAAYFTRGTSKDRYARYTEDGAAYVDNMQRLLRKFETAKALVPAPVIRARGAARRAPASIWFGSTGAAMAESLAALAARGHPPRPDAHPRVSRSPTRSPSSSPRTSTCSSSSRTATRSCKMLLVNECGIDPAEADLRSCTTTARRSPRASSPARSPRRRACST